MIACFLCNISAKYYKNPSMLSRVIAKNVGDVFFETQCICKLMYALFSTFISRYGSWKNYYNRTRCDRVTVKIDCHVFKDKQG